MTDTEFNAALNEARCRFIEAQEKQKQAEQDAVKLLEPRFRAAIAARDFKLAFDVAFMLPDCVSRVFWVDNVCNARGDYEIKRP